MLTFFSGRYFHPLHHSLLTLFQIPGSDGGRSVQPATLELDWMWVTAKIWPIFSCDEVVRFRSPDKFFSLVTIVKNIVSE